MVPKNLSAEQKHERMATAQDCPKQVESDPTLLDRVITGDESWFSQYNPETKWQSQQWLSPGSARPKKAKMSKSKVKTKIIVFFDSKGIVHKEFVPPGQTINQQFYLKVLDRLWKWVVRVRPGIAKTWVLYHDNVPCHRAFSVTQFLSSKRIPVLLQPPYSPDMSPCDFLLPRVKQVVKGMHFESVTDIQNSVTRVLQEVPVQAFQKCYKNWKNRWNQCVVAEGEYFEGDNINVS